MRYVTMEHSHLIEHAAMCFRVENLGVKIKLHLRLRCLSFRIFSTEERAKIVDFLVEDI